MSSDLLTFGEFLSALLKKKNISISKMANFTNTKSRNTIQRLLKDESSIDIIQEFKTKLINLEPPCLTTSLELEQLEKSVEVSRLGKDTIYTRKVLLELFTNQKTVSTSYSVRLFDSTTNQSKLLKQLFQSYINYSSVTMIIFDATFIELSEALISFIHTASNTVISIEQIVYLGDHNSRNADTFASIYKLLNYRYYNVYCNSSFEPQHSSKKTISVLSNFVVVDKVSTDGIRHTDLIKIDNEMNFSISSNNSGDSLYSFYSNYFETLKDDCLSIRRFYDNSDIIDKLIEICDYMLYLEKSTAEYLIKQNMCFQMIPIDILYKMLVDSDFLGLSEDHPKIQKLIQIATDRFNNYFSINKMKISLFTKRGLLDFAKHRTLTDHLYYFRAFTNDEVRFTLKFILNQIENNSFFKLYLLKDDYCIGTIEYNYYENHVLYLIDSCSGYGYGEDFSEGIITAQPIITIFDDFIKNELIMNHTLPESETIIFLNYLISTIE